MAPSATDSCKDEELLYPANSPPPYEAQAYPRIRSRHFLLRKSSQVSLAIAFTFVISWLCLILERETTLRHATRPVYSSPQLGRFKESLQHCAALRTFPARPDPESRKQNPRWNAIRGQRDAITLINATLFDGEEALLLKRMDITFEKGLVVDVSETTDQSISKGGVVHDLNGRWVTPGLVDMHSHHSLSVWPIVSSNDDTNEMNPLFGPLTPFVRALDGMKAYDAATIVIMSGGVTSSLIIPGSANIMGGEGAVVKNALKSGELGEYIVEEMLLEHGIPITERHRYMKMACGENPSRVYSHTRMGNSWILREHLAKAKELMEKQDGYCVAISRAASASATEKLRFLDQMGSFPTDLKLESTVGMLRGRVALQNHCYLPEDMEAMLRISHEFGFRVHGFHHAIEAWQVPEMIKKYGENITIATFAEFSLYKWEAYFPSLYAGSILAKAGIPVAYKSDHVMDDTSAKYLMSQAQVAHWFHIGMNNALKSVTSVPAKAIDLDYRIGYARPGYDADIVVWDANPLAVGATPLQVYIDGVAQLDPAEVKKSTGTALTDPVPESAVKEPKARIRFEEEYRAGYCTAAKKPSRKFVVTGIKKTFLDNYPELAASVEAAQGYSLTLVIDDGSVRCLGTPEVCAEATAAVQGEDLVTLNLESGYLLPGLTALTTRLGLSEIMSEANTGDGNVNPFSNAKDPSNVEYAKYGVMLKGKAFSRARMGGVTRAISPPGYLAGPIGGVSVGILTGGNKSLLDGGVFQSDVALHAVLDIEDQPVTSTISGAVKLLREILVGGQEEHNGTVYGQVAAGKLPLVVMANNQYDIQQLIMIKKDFPKVNLVLQGGAEAPFVAKELAEAKIPVILTKNRPGLATFRHKDSVIGPPLTPSIASYLSHAGVFYAIAITPLMGDFRIHDLALEAAWVAKYAGLSDKELARLVSTNVEDILGLKKSKDIVLWEGSPFQYGGAVALSFHEDQHGKLEVSACWPDDSDE